MIILRKILFYLFLAVYLVLCPLIILYALGYIFTPKAEEGFAKTGLIHLETVPSGASLLIANRRYGEKTPATIRNLLPGSYDVKIVKPGCRPWNRKVAVEPGKAVAFSQILLVPKKVKTRALLAQPFRELVPIPETRFLILFGTRQAGDIRVFDWKSGSSVPLVAVGSPLVHEVCERYFFSKGSPFFLLKMSGGKEGRYLWCRVDREKPEIREISDLFVRGEPAEVRWEGGNPEYLFALYGRDLVRLGLEKKSAASDFFTKIQGYGLYKGRVFGLRSFTMIRRNFDARAADPGTVIEKGTFLENLFRESGVYKIDFLSNDTLCFLCENGELLSNELPYHFVKEGVRGYEADPDGRKVLLWKTTSFGVLDFSRPAGKKELFKRGPEIDWAFDGGSDLQQAFFVYGTSHVLFRDQDGLFLVPIGEGGRSPREFLAKVLGNTAVFYSDKTGECYYLEPSRGYLTVLEVLPPEAKSLVYMFGEKEIAGKPQ